MGDYLMSLIKANDIQNASGGIPTVKGQKLIPTAWVNFNGTGTVAIRDSEGVSSITDDGTGRYTANFTTALANANYAVLFGNTENTNNDGYVMNIFAPYSTTGIGMSAFNTNNFAKTDQTYVSVAIMGGQA